MLPGSQEMRTPSLPIGHSQVRKPGCRKGPPPAVRAGADLGYRCLYSVERGVLLCMSGSALAPDEGMAQGSGSSSPACAIPFQVGAPCVVGTVARRNRARR